MSQADMNEPENADLRRIYAASPRDEPPAELDAAVLAQVQRAAMSKPGARASSRQWSRLVAIAATLVVTASLVLLMENERPQIGTLAPPARDAALTPAAKLQTEAVQATEIPPPEVAQREEKPRSRGTLDTPARDRPSDQTVREHAEPASPAPQAADAAKAGVPAPERQAFPAARMAATEEARAPAAAPAPPAALARQDSALQQGGVAAPAAANIASGAAPAERRSQQAAGSVVRNSASQDTARKDESPEAWLARIAEMRKQGRIKEADDSFVEFRKRYPDYQIPAATAESLKP